jgi:hypothetical protein
VSIIYIESYIVLNISRYFRPKTVPFKFCSNGICLLMSAIIIGFVQDAKDSGFGDVKEDNLIMAFLEDFPGVSYIVKSCLVEMTEFFFYKVGKDCAIA